MVDRFDDALGRLRLGEPLPVDAVTYFNERFAALRPKLVRLCSAWLHDPARGEEIAHDALAEAWAKLGELTGAEHLDAWVCQIARFKSNNQRRRVAEYLFEDGVVEATSERATVIKLLLREEREALLLEAMGDLPEEDQEALFLRYVEGLSVEDITQRLALTNAAGARGVLQRAKRRLDANLRLALAKRGHGSSFFWTSVL